MLLNLSLLLTTLLILPSNSTLNSTRTPSTLPICPNSNNCTGIKDPRILNLIHHGLTTLADTSPYAETKFYNQQPISCTQMNKMLFCASLQGEGTGQGLSSGDILEVIEGSRDFECIHCGKIPIPQANDSTMINRSLIMDRWVPIPGFVNWPEVSALTDVHSGEAGSWGKFGDVEAVDLRELACGEVVEAVDLKEMAYKKMMEEIYQMDGLEVPFENCG